MIGDMWTQKLTVQQRFLNLRYQGTDNAIMIEKPENGNYREAFEAQYKREYGFLMPVSSTSGRTEQQT